jgi:hypothetical protein
MLNILKNDDKHPEVDSLRNKKLEIPAINPIIPDRGKLSKVIPLLDLCPRCHLKQRVSKAEGWEENPAN